MNPTQRDLIAEAKECLSVVAMELAEEGAPTFHLVKKAIAQIRRFEKIQAEYEAQVLKGGGV